MSDGQERDEASEVNVDGNEGEVLNPFGPEVTKELKKAEALAASGGEGEGDGEKKEDGDVPEWAQKMFAENAQLKEKVERLEGGNAEDGDDGKVDLEEVDWDGMGSKDLAMVTMKATENLMAGVEKKMTERVAAAMGGLQVMIAKSAHPDFEDFIEGKEGMKALADRNPHWSVEECYGMAKRLGGGGKAVERKQVNGDSPPRSPSRRTRTRPGASGELSVEAALVQAVRDVKQAGGSFIKDSDEDSF